MSQIEDKKQPNPRNMGPEALDMIQTLMIHTNTRTNTTKNFNSSHCNHMAI